MKTKSKKAQTTVKAWAVVYQGILQRIYEVKRAAIADAGADSRVVRCEIRLLK